MIKHIKLLEYHGEIMYYFKGGKCKTCGTKPSFDGWDSTFTPSDEISHGGYCLQHLISLNMDNMWGPDWIDKVKQFLRDNPELCLEES